MSVEKRRYEIKWIDQNVIEVTDLVSDDFWFMNGCIKILHRYEELPPELANVYFEGYMAGVDWADSQLRHSIHNFVQRE